MTSRNLSSVTTELFTSYGNTAQNVIHACRAGNERIVALLGERWENALSKSASKLDPEVRNNASLAQKKISAYYTNGLAFTTGSVETAVSKAIELARRGIQQVAANASQFEQRTGISSLNTLALVAVPAVEAVNKLAGKLEQKTGRIANQIAGHSAKVEVAAVKRETAFKRARNRKVA